MGGAHPAARDEGRGGEAQLQLEAADQAGLVSIADSLAWNEWESTFAAPLLRDLGPKAAPVCPSLVRLLDGNDAPWAWFQALQIIAAIGPGAASTKPAIERLLARDRDPRFDEERWNDLREEAATALAAIAK